MGHNRVTDAVAALSAPWGVRELFFLVHPIE
jgi:hypothetical protein